MKDISDLSIKQLREEIKKRRACNLNLLSEEDVKEIKRYRTKGRPHASRTLKSVKRYYRVDKQPRKFDITRDYDFLTYYGIVIKWALQHRPDLDEMSIKILLCLYGQGHFYKSEFTQVFHAITIVNKPSATTKLKWFLDNGYIKIYRHRTIITKELYGLTVSTCRFLNKIHTYCCGEEKVPIKELQIKKEDWRITSPIKKRKTSNMLKILELMDKKIKQRDQNEQTD